MKSEHEAIGRAREARLYLIHGETIVAELARLQMNGRCTPEGIVTAARAKDSPLHHFFTWADLLEDYPSEKLQVMLHQAIKEAQRREGKQSEVKQ